MASPGERNQALVQWVEEAGGSLHPSVEIYHDAVTKGSFRVKEGCTLQQKEAIVTLPISQSLSYLNAVCGHAAFPEVGPGSFGPPEGRAPAEWFPADFLRETPPHVIGRFKLIQEYLLGPASAWWPYIRTLPQPEHMASMLPALWPKDDIDFLLGTEAYNAVKEIKKTLKREFAAAMARLPESYALTYNRPLYHWAYAIFTSRSFRPSLIIPDAPSLNLACEIDDFSVLLPLYDVGNHSPLAKAPWATDRATQLCKLLAGQTCHSGEQVFNNYGMKTNAELLLGYGFILPETCTFHNDYHHVKTKSTDDDDLAGFHLVSLRPMTDASSLVGQSKRLMGDDSAVTPVFAHIQDSLVTTLYESLRKQLGLDAADAANNDDDDDDDGTSMDDIMAGRIAPELRDRIVGLLGSKLSNDLDELDAYEMPLAANANQRLALEYRGQCRSVIVAALRSLMADDG